MAANDMIENRTFDEILVDDTASVVRFGLREFSKETRPIRSCGNSRSDTIPRVRPSSCRRPAMDDPEISYLPRRCCSHRALARTAACAESHCIGGSTERQLISAPKTIDWRKNE